MIEVSGDKKPHLAPLTAILFNASILLWRFNHLGNRGTDLNSPILKVPTIKINPKVLILSAPYLCHHHAVSLLLSPNLS